MAKVNEGRSEIFDCQLLQSQLVAVELDVDLSTINFSALKPKEYVIDEAKTERLLGGANESSSTKSDIGCAKRSEDQSKVRISVEVIFSKDLVVEDEELFELIETVVVKRNGFNFSEECFFHVGSVGILRTDK